MRKFVATTALALVLAGSAYAQGHHGGGGGGSTRLAAITDLPLEGPSGQAAGGQSGGGPGPSAQPAPSGSSIGNPGPTGKVYNRAQTGNGGNRSRFTERIRGELYNLYHRFERRKPQ
jgi:hypothetical protein